MTFQASDLRWHQFLKLIDNENNLIEPSYMNSGLYLKYFEHSNSLCTRAMKAIVNHAPIGEYKVRFFLRKEFKCSCSLYPIKLRQHILYEYKRFNRYWNLRRDTLSHIILFLEFKSSAFAFNNAIT